MNRRSALWLCALSACSARWVAPQHPPRVRLIPHDASHDVARDVSPDVPTLPRAQCRWETPTALTRAPSGLEVRAQWTVALTHAPERSEQRYRMEEGTDFGVLGQSEILRIDVATGSSRRIARVPPPTTVYGDSVRPFGGRVLMRSSASQLRMLDAVSSRVLWELPGAEWIWAHAHNAQGIVWTGQRRRAAFVSAVDPASGDARWERALAVAGAVRSVELVGDCALLVQDAGDQVSQTCVISLLDTRNGDVQWTRSLDRGQPRQWDPCELTRTGSTLIVSSGMTAVLIDGPTGQAGPAVALAPHQDRSLQQDGSRWSYNAYERFPNTAAETRDTHPSDDEVTLRTTLDTQTQRTVQVNLPGELAAGLIADRWWITWSTHGVLRAYDRATLALQWRSHVGSAVSVHFVPAEAPRWLVVQSADAMRGFDLINLQSAESPALAPRTVIEGSVIAPSMRWRAQPIVLRIGDARVMTDRAGRFRTTITGFGVVRIEPNLDALVPARPHRDGCAYLQGESPWIALDGGTHRVTLPTLWGGCD
ncbi:MAG: PQQ-binding-like beta-propeller repeat protein [Deltaproteobacteria bacterium]|nr:PQQ-binding-like beta-propeller repeat protein [Deltaproteobacteria bacterium]